MVHCNKIKPKLWTWHPTDDLKIKNPHFSTGDWLLFHLLGSRKSWPTQATSLRQLPCWSEVRSFKLREPSISKLVSDLRFLRIFLNRCFDISTLELDFAILIRTLNLFSYFLQVFNVVYFVFGWKVKKEILNENERRGSHIFFVTSDASSM